MCLECALHSNRESDSKNGPTKIYQRRWCQVNWKKCHRIGQHFVYFISPCISLWATYFSISSSFTLLFQCQQWVAIIWSLPGSGHQTSEVALCWLYLRSYGWKQESQVRNEVSLSVNDHLGNKHCNYLTGITFFIHYPAGSVNLYFHKSSRSFNALCIANFILLQNAKVKWTLHHHPFPAATLWTSSWNINPDTSKYS